MTIGKKSFKFCLALLKNIKTLCMEKKTKLNILGSSQILNKKIFYLIILLVVKITTLSKKDTYDVQDRKFEV